MMKYNRKIEKCKKIIYSSNNLYILVNEDGQNRLMNVENEILTIKISEKYNPVFIAIENKIYYSDYESNVYEVNLELNKTNILTTKMTLVDGNGNYIIADQSSKEKDFSIVINVKNEECLITFDLNVSKGYFYSDYMFVFDIISRQKLYCCDLKHKLIKYTLNLGELGFSFNENERKSILQTIGIYKQLLWVHISKYSLVAIDIYTGSVEFEMTDFIGEEKRQYFKFGSTSNRTPMEWVMDEKNGKMYLLSRMYLFEFDLDTRELKVLKDYSITDEWSFTKAELSNDNLLFYGSKGNKWLSSAIGIFSLKENEVVWCYEHEEERNYFLEVPKLHDGKLYALDNKDVLHIFEKE